MTCYGSAAVQPGWQVCLKDHAFHTAGSMDQRDSGRAVLNLKTALTVHRSPRARQYSECRWIRTTS